MLLQWTILKKIPHLQHLRIPNSSGLSQTSVFKVRDKRRRNGSQSGKLENTKLQKLKLEGRFEVKNNIINALSTPSTKQRSYFPIPIKIPYSSRAVEAK